MSELDDKIAALKARQGITDSPKPAAKKVTKKKAAGKKVVRKATRPNKQAERAELFAHTYVQHGCNATIAYKAISPNCKDSSAQVLGHKMLSRVMVQNIVAPLLEALLVKNAVDTEFVLTRMLEQANASPLDYFYVDDRGQIVGMNVGAVNDAQRRNLRSIKMTENSFIDKSGNEHTSRSWHVTVVDQQKAIDMFARYLNMFTKEDEAVDDRRIGDLIERGVKRIRANRDLEAWRKGVFEGTFSEIG